MRFMDKPKRKVLINITSLIDVMFLLLIFFMVSSTFLEQPGMKLELPESQSHEVTELKELTLQITADGKVFLDGTPVPMEQLQDSLQTAALKLKDRSLILKADKQVTHGQVVTVMDVAKRSGFRKLVIATRVEKTY